MTFLDVIQLSLLLEQTRYNIFLDKINQFYKPNSLYELILKIKESFFTYNKTYDLQKNINNKNVTLNTTPISLLNITTKKDIIVEGSFKYKINYPNILTLEDSLLNICSIIKEIYLNNKWMVIESYNLQHIQEILYNLPIDDKILLTNYYNKFLSDIKTDLYIDMPNYKEYLDLDIIKSFIIINFKYNTNYLYESMINLMRGFNFNYSDFKTSSFFEILNLINVVSNIVNNENNVNNSDE